MAQSASRGVGKSERALPFFPFRFRPRTVDFDCPGVSVQLRVPKKFDATVFCGCLFPLNRDAWRLGSMTETLGGEHVVRDCERRRGAVSWTGAGCPKY